MILRRAMAVGFLLLFLGVSALAVEGTFQGKIIGPPAQRSLDQGWIYVQGRNRLLRRVEVSHASIVFGENVPRSQRHQCDVSCLGEGIEVRVTAEQDSLGEWRARRVEILALPTGESKAVLTTASRAPE